MLANIMESKISYSFSDSDIKSFFKPGLKFMYKYSDLQNMDTIDNLFASCNFAVILIETKFNVGHWVCVMKYQDGTIEQFDSYGGKIDNELKYISHGQRKLLHEICGTNGFRLTELLNEYPGQVVFNHYRFQKLENNIKTCGRWCVMRLLFFLNGYDIDDFTTEFKFLRGLYRLKNDQLVCVLIPS